LPKNDTINGAIITMLDFMEEMKIEEISRDFLGKVLEMRLNRND